MSIGNDSKYYGGGIMYQITRIINGVETKIELTDSEVMEVYYKRDREMYVEDLRKSYGDQFTDEEYEEAALDLPYYIFDEANVTFDEAVERAYETMLVRRKERAKH